MPTRETAPVGAPCWIDLSSSDTGGSCGFYGDLLGWTSEVGGPEYGGYISYFRAGVQVAGCMGNDGSTGMPDVWSVYLASDDAAATCELVTSHGGAILVPPMEVPGLGIMAVVTDPSQAAIGIWQPLAHKGFGVFAESNAPAWFELHTRDYDAVIPFYRDVFGWDPFVMSDDPAFRYTTMGEGEAALAGVMDAGAFLPDGVPSRWVVYFQVDDTDAAVARVLTLGGTLLREAQDSPHGRVAEVADTTGATFRLISNP